MQLTLSEQDAHTLRNLLRDYLPTLAHDAARMAVSACEVSRREALCDRLLRELGAAGHAPGAGCGRATCRSGGLSAADLAGYQQRLREIAARLGGQVTALEAEARQPTGTALGTTEEAAAVALLHAEEGTLADVTAALDRIDRGTYGRCESCGKPVAKARLDALPHARQCIACARTAAD